MKPEDKQVLDWALTAIDTNKKDIIKNTAEKLEKNGNIPVNEIARTISGYGIAGHTYVYDLLDTKYKDIEKVESAQKRKKVPEKSVPLLEQEVEDSHRKLEILTTGEPAPVSPEEKQTFRVEVNRDGQLTTPPGFIMATKSTEEKEEPPGEIELNLVRYGSALGDSARNGRKTARLIHDGIKVLDVKY